MSIISSLIIPFIICSVLITGIYKKINCFSSFKKGAEEGIITIIKLIPTYIGLFVAISVFESTGIIEIISNCISPILKIPHLVSETLSLMFLRPISGSASLALLENIINDAGINSKVAMAACIMMGSTETIFYTMSVYTNNTKIKKMRGVLASSLIANFISCIAAVIWALFIC